MPQQRRNSTIIYLIYVTELVLSVVCMIDTLQEIYGDIRWSEVDAVFYVVVLANFHSDDVNCDEISNPTYNYVYIYMLY